MSFLQTPEPPMSTLEWPSATEAPPPDNGTRLAWLKDKANLPEVVRASSDLIAGYRGAMTPRGNVFEAEVFLRGKDGHLTRVPLVDQKNSTVALANEIREIGSAQANADGAASAAETTARQPAAGPATPSDTAEAGKPGVSARPAVVAGWFQGSSENGLALHFRVGTEYVKPEESMRAPRSRSARTAERLTSKHATPRDDRREQWDAFPLGNNQFLVPQIGVYDGGYAACQIAMRMGRGETIAQATQLKSNRELSRDF